LELNSFDFAVGADQDFVEHQVDRPLLLISCPVAQDVAHPVHAGQRHLQWVANSSEPALVLRSRVFMSN